jgi:hypothetical protein
VVLHIGPMKTGTTYVQNLLEENRDVLREQGWAVPRQPLVVRGVRQVLGLTDAGQEALDHTPDWDELSRRVREHDGRGALLSMEFLSYAGRPAVARVLEGLRGTDVHVVLTVRDAAGALPSQWQSLSRNGGILSWPEFATEIRSAGPRDKGRAIKQYRRTQDVPRMLETWARAVPRERLTVVTVPPSSAPRSLLWERLLSVAGIDPATTSTVETAFGNPQLGYGSCELLRRLNAAGLHGARPSAYRRVVRHVARNYLLPLRDGQSKPRLDRGTAEFAAAANAATRRVIEKRATLVGDLDDLPVRPPAEGLDPGERPRQAPDEEVRRAADAALAGTLAYCAAHDVRLPAGTPRDLRGDVGEAIEQVAALMRLAMSGDPSHDES